MHETRLFRADMFCQVGQECDDIMLCDGLDFINAGDVKFHVLGFPDGIRVFAGNDAEVCHGFAGVCLDLVPDLELGLRRPVGNHFRTGIAGDHGQKHLYVIGRQMLGLLEEEGQNSKSGRSV